MYMYMCRGAHHNTTSVANELIPIRDKCNTILTCDLCSTCAPKFCAHSTIATCDLPHVHSFVSNNFVPTIQMQHVITHMCTHLLATILCTLYYCAKVHVHQHNCKILFTQIQLYDKIFTLSKTRTVLVWLGSAPCNTIAGCNQVVFINSPHGLHKVPKATSYSTWLFENRS